jgi:hypothetical protein
MAAHDWPPPPWSKDFPFADAPGAGHSVEIARDGTRIERWTWSPPEPVSEAQRLVRQALERVAEDEDEW